MMFLSSALSPPLRAIGMGTLLIASLAACDAPQDTSSVPTEACEGFETGQDGMVEVTEIDFMMPGVWEVRFDVQTAAAEPDRVVFAFCIEG